MVLGKRNGSLIKRTTSMKMITVDAATIYDASQPSDYLPMVVMATTKNDDFLTTCNLCNRNLCHRRDIYMYRGNNAFCSLECREKQIKMDEKKQIKMDERKVKNGIVSLKKPIHI